MSAADFVSELPVTLIASTARSQALPALRSSSMSSEYGVFGLGEKPVAGSGCGAHQSTGAKAD